MTPVSIRAELLTGRYHAHPWGEAQHAMAGPEWPPSPWRLLRALASAWFDANPRLSTPAERDTLLDTLGQRGAPELWLPPSSFSEIPYYQPVKKDGQVGARVLHFDHFAVVQAGDDGTSVFYFVFDVELSPQQEGLLRELLGRIRYLGRTESRVVLQLTGGEAPASHLQRVIPAPQLERFDRGIVRRRILVPRKNKFCASDLWMTAKGSEAPLPTHLVESILAAGTALPSGAEWCDYAVPVDLLRAELPVRRPTIERRNIECREIEYSLFRRVPIPLGESVQIAREFREKAVSYCRGSVRLSGREQDGRVARGHTHAFYLPIPSRATSQLERLRVWLPSASFNADEFDALLSVNRLLEDDEYPVVAVAQRWGSGDRSTTKAKVWRSVTPFLPPLRRRKGRARTCPEQQLIACVAEVSGSHPSVRRIAGPRGLGKITPVRAHLYRGPAGWTWTRRAAHWFELMFDEPVTMSRPVGADAHFGMGQFKPVL